MKLQIQETTQFIIADKPYGITTHKVDDFKDGFKEFLEQKLSIELAIVSRLDATTSGLILFPRKEMAGEINSLWQSDSCVKTYLFVTDRPYKNTDQKIIVQSLIEQRPDKSWTSDVKKPPNAFSEFRFINSVPISKGSLYFWEVTIKTGKTHQIRLHAKDLGIPILGDIKYSGTPYFRIALHCQEIQFAGQTFISPSPFEEINNPYYPFIAEFEKRSRLYVVDSHECFRWLHNEVGNFLLDQYGSHLFFYVYFGSDAHKAQGPSALNIDTIEKAKDLTEWISSYFKKPVFLKPMYDRGRAPQKNDLLYFENKIWKPDFTEQKWVALENGLKFQLKSHQGQSPGLFLDQRENRKWVLNNSENKKVLNLFSYTSGFSVCAAVGKAVEVTTVDLSKNFIEWSKENFHLNGLEISERYQFWSADTMHFMKGAINKNRKWDLIVCDPPTFGRSDKGTFQIDHDIELLLQNCFSCLNSNGRILFATNFEKWNLEAVFNRVQNVLTSKKFRFSLEKTTYQSLDFDFPNQNGKMKSLFITKID